MPCFFRKSTYIYMYVAKIINHLANDVATVLRPGYARI